MSSSQDICSSLVLASRDTSDSVRQHCCLCFLFLYQESFHSWHMCIYFGTFCHYFYKNKSVLPPSHVPGACIIGRPSLEVLSHLSYKVVSLFLDLQMVVSDFSSDLDLFCHVIQSQAALVCASCARSLGSGNRCPEVLWSGVLALLLPSFSSLSSMARKLINFQSCTILLVAFLGKCQVFGLKISFKKAIGSSSYSSITISSRVLLLIFMEFFSSSFLAEVSFKKNFHREGSWRIFILHNCL